MLLFQKKKLRYIPFKILQQKSFLSVAYSCSCTRTTRPIHSIMYYRCIYYTAKTPISAKNDVNISKCKDLRALIKQYSRSIGCIVSNDDDVNLKSKRLTAQRNNLVVHINNRKASMTCNDYEFENYKIHINI